ncbi:MAG: T9SS type A sorting domain-containing protein [Bacteroidota bacterium]
MERKAYSDAILWYENDILNPASLDDSIYSIIDLEDTYLLMAADSNSDAGYSNYIGTLVQYKPKTVIEFREIKEELINLLFKEILEDDTKPLDQVLNEQGYTLSQNHPNPFKTETILNYSIPEKCSVRISVSTILGRHILSLNISQQEPGEYSARINLNNVPDGLYIFSLVVNEKEVARVKGIKMD